MVHNTKHKQVPVVHGGQGLALYALNVKKPINKVEAEKIALSAIPKKKNMTSKDFKAYIQFRHLPKSKFMPGRFNKVKVNKSLVLIVGTLRPEHMKLAGSGLFDYIEKAYQLVKDSPLIGKVTGNLNTLSPETKLMAHMAEEAYNNNPKSSIHDYTLDTTLSTAKALVYKHDATKTVIIAFRGTKTDDGHDIISDIHLATGNAHVNSRFHDSQALLNNVKEKYKGWNIKLTGHSLGGAIVVYLLLHNPGITGETFNPGSGLDKTAFHGSNIGHRLTNHIIKGDFASAVQKNGRNIIYAPKHGTSITDIHSMRNFLAGGIIKFKIALYKYLNGSGFQDYLQEIGLDATPVANTEISPNHWVANTSPNDKIVFDETFYNSLMKNALTPAKFEALVKAGKAKGYHDNYNEYIKKFTDIQRQRATHNASWEDKVQQDRDTTTNINNAYDEYIKLHPEEEMVWCPYDSNGNLNRTKCTRAEAIQNYIKYYRKSAGDSFFGQMVNGLTDFADDIVMNLPLPGWQELIKPLYKNFAPPTSKYFTGKSFKDNAENFTADAVVDIAKKAMGSGVVHHPKRKPRKK